MMEKVIFKVYLGVLAGIMILISIATVKAQSTQKFSNLTQLSPREWIDTSKVTYVQLPVYIPTPGCNDCSTRWGAGLVVDGVRLEFSEEAEVEVRRLLNVK